MGRCRTGVNGNAAQSQPNHDRKQSTHSWYSVGHLWVEIGKERCLHFSVLLMNLLGILEMIEKFQQNRLIKVVSTGQTHSISL